MAASAKENSGCLSIFLPFFGSSKETSTDELPYRLRDDFLSPAEFSFFKVLSHVLGASYTVQSKVRLADIFFVSRPNENRSYFSRISPRHVDFLVCESTTMQPVFAVELDDASHHGKKQQERDDFVDSVFEVAGLPLLHLPNQREYSTKVIAEQVAIILNHTEDSPASDEPELIQQAPSIPHCPKCGIPMVLRTVSKGEHKGKQFYGCKNYPQCRQVEVYPYMRNVADSK